ncbi:MAG: nitroreductase [Bacteroidota bacterium]
MNFDVQEVSRLIRSRRSIYPAMYSGEIVSDDIIREMLENANWAPNHGLTEPWRFIVFKGEGIKELARFQSELYRERTTASGDFQEMKFEKLASKPLLCSHIIAIGMKRPDGKKFPEVEEIEAVACAVQNMYLTATAHGVGCYWGSGGVTYWEEAKSFFDLGADDRLLGFLYVGMPRGNWPEGRRTPMDDKVRWVS